MKQIRLVFFGDSICFGQGISIHKGWVPRIGEKLEYLSSEIKKEIYTVNASISGNTTRDALGRIAYEIQSHQYDIVVLQFGMNDCNYWETDKGLPRVSMKGFEANLHEIIDRVLNFGAKKIIMHTNHPTTRITNFSGCDFSYQQSNEEYNQIIRAVSNERPEAVLIDIESKIKESVSKGLFELKDLLLEDGLHLSLNGHDVYYDLVFEEIVTAVRNCE